MILSQDYLSIHAKELKLSSDIKKFAVEQSAILNENQRLANSQNTLEPGEKTYDIFLSHSSLDNQLVLSLVDLFNKANFSVYVDWIEDTELDRNNVTPLTAEILRERMVNSSGLAYVSTSNISDSRWCPWELGYFDGNKNGRCAILPIMKSPFKGQEYLGLYPYIDYQANQRGKDCFWVNDPNDSSAYIELHRWLQGEELFSHK